MRLGSHNTVDMCFTADSPNSRTCILAFASIVLDNVSAADRRILSALGRTPGY